MASLVPEVQNTPIPPGIPVAAITHLEQLFFHIIPTTQFGEETHKSTGRTGQAEDKRLTSFKQSIGHNLNQGLSAMPGHRESRRGRSKPTSYSRSSSIDTENTMVNNHN